MERQDMKPGYEVSWLGTAPDKSSFGNVLAGGVAVCAIFNNFDFNLEKLYTEHAHFVIITTEKVNKKKFNKGACA